MAFAWIEFVRTKEVVVESREKFIPPNPPSPSKHSVRAQTHRTFCFVSLSNYCLQGFACLFDQSILTKFLVQS